MKSDLVNTVLNSSTELAIIATSPEGVIQVFNRGAELMLGYCAEEMLGKQTPAIFHEDNEVKAYASVLSANYGKDISGFRVFVHEPEIMGHESRMWTYIRKNKTRLTVNLTITPMRDEEMNIIGYMGIAQDITKIRSLESDLLISDRRFSDAFHSAAHGMGLVSIEGRWLDANAALCKMLGYEKNELLLLDFQRITHPDDLVPDLGLVNKLIDGEILSYQMEKRYLHKNGKIIYVLLSVSLVRDMQNVPLYFVSQIQDLTESKELEKQAVTRQKYLQLVLDAVADGIVTLDEQLVIEKHNPGASRILDNAGAELSGLSILKFIQANSQDKFADFCKAFITYNDGKDQKIEVLGRRSQKTDYELECHISKLEIENITKLVLVLRDISQLKHNERLKSEFVSTVSHELRTPLTAIKGSLELISLGALGEVNQSLLPVIDISIRNTLRLSNLINDLLDIDKLSVGKLELNTKEQRLMPIIEDVIALNSRFAEEYRVNLELFCGYDCWVNVDTQRLHQILANFISNAAKFSPLNSQVEIAVYPVEHSVRIAVRDYGSGISDDLKPRLFTRFSQGDGSDSRKKGGTGLGLAISKELATAMSASVGFSSQNGQGSTFYIDLPCKPAGEMRAQSTNLREVS